VSDEEWRPGCRFDGGGQGTSPLMDVGGSPIPLLYAYCAG